MCVTLCHCCVDSSVTVVLTTLMCHCCVNSSMCHLASLLCVLTAVCVTVLCVTVLLTSFSVLHQEMEAPAPLADTVVEPTPGQNGEHRALILL